jgi:3',5'-cyclic AMP phosphodiesterase CpdA
MLIAQITDCHVKRDGRLAFGAVDAAGMLERAVAKLNDLDPQPDVVLATGDLVDAGDADEYRRLRAILGRLRARLLLLPGNHDLRAPLRAAFPDHGYLAGPDGSCCYVDERGPVRLVALDSIEEGRVGGVFDMRRIAWLDATLAARPDAPTLVFTHHPPFATGIDHIDEHGLAGGEALAAVVARHRQVVRVVAGHVHRSMSVAWGGTLCTTCPSTAYLFALDLATDTPAFWTDEPPGFQLHHWRPDVGLVTLTAITAPHARTAL